MTNDMTMTNEIYEREQYFKNKFDSSTTVVRIVADLSGNMSSFRLITFDPA